MPSENICMFITSGESGVDLMTINFVYEKECFADKLVIMHTHSINIVVNGNGILHNQYGNYPIQEGDLFFTFSGQAFCVENKQDLHYIYITFLGTRANALLKRLHRNPKEPVCKGQKNLISIWKEAIKISNEKNIDLISESILLYSLSHVCNVYKKNKINSSEVDVIIKIKKYAEERFSDPTLTLNSVSKMFSYSHKYISEKFKKTVKTGFNEYLQNLRFRYAIQLISNGMKNVNEISKLCGYSDPLYFSKVFKKKAGLAPKKFMAQNEATIFSADIEAAYSPPAPESLL